MTKLLQKTINKKSYIPLLHYIKVHNGQAMASDMEIQSTMPTSAPNGLYDAIEFEAGIYNDATSKHEGEEYPIFEAQEYFASITLEAAELVKAFQFVEHAQSNEATRYYLCGVFFNTDNGDMVATDGHRMNVYNLPTIKSLSSVNNHQHGGGKGFILPREVIALLLLDKKLSGNLLVEVNARFIRFKHDNFEIIAKHIDGTYPDYKRVIPAIADEHKTIKIHNKAWRKAYGIAKKLKPSHYTGEGFKYGVNMLADDNSEGISKEYGFEPNYINDALSIADVTWLEMRCNDNNQPYIWEAEGKKIIIMPKRA
jgi:DNA polymerase-3 subunit beta